MIEKINLDLDDRGLDIRKLVEDKINELIEAHNELEKRVKGQAYENDPLNRIG